jgi:hypothetical protein
VGAQGLAAATGLFMARWMSVADYALYTVMVTLIGTMNVLTKGGTHFGYSSILGRIWPDKARAAQAVKAVLTVRRAVSQWTLPPVLLLTSWLLHKNGASVGEIVVLCTLLYVMWWADMQTRLVDQILFYAHQTTRVQILDTILAALRLAGATILYLLGFLNVIFAVVLSVLMSLSRVPFIVRWVHRLVPVRDAGADQSDIDIIKDSVRKQLPVEIYMILQTQIILVLLSVLGTGSDVAGFGALGRIGFILVPLTMFSSAFLIPIYTRAKNHLFLLLGGLVFLAALPCLFLIVLTYTYPNAMLWLIGENYAELKVEVLWAVSVSAAMRLATIYRNLIGSRGWIRLNLLQIPLFIIWIITATFILNISTIVGAFQLQLGFAAIIAIAASVDLIAAGVVQKPK